MRYCDVIIDLTAIGEDRVFTYAVPEGVSVTPGMRVSVNFGGRRAMEGYVVLLKDETDLDAARVKPILRVIDKTPVILPELVELAHYMREQYQCLLVEALRLFLPPLMRGERIADKTRVMARLVRHDEVKGARQREILRILGDGDRPASEFPAASLKALIELGLVEKYAETLLRRPYGQLNDERIPPVMLTQLQERAFRDIVLGGRFLLHGVTGSGKTEVYLRVVDEQLKLGRTAIVLVPEIALTPQMVSWFRRRFGDVSAVLHSGLSPGERYDEWKRLKDGSARVVIGARSAVFAPLSNLGVIVVDEEHEQSYISESHPRYDAREVAAQRCKIARATLILGSATPSISTYMRAMPGVRPENKLELVELNRRVNGLPLPKVTLIDMRRELMRGNKSIFSGEMAAGLRETIAHGRQAILFLNRRGHSTFISCRSCGYVERCAQCDVSMTYHMHDGVLRCHYCGLEKRPPSVCPNCGSEAIRFFGVGTQKVEDELKKLFPGVNVLRMDVDTTRKAGALVDILQRFQGGDAQVLIGTQMVAKGLDFPMVTLVGVIAADTTLNLPDYRAPERTFQLITQVAGRAGRAGDAGRVVVQTYNPEHYAVKLAAGQDYRAFYMEECDRRRKGLYPPYTVIARLVTSDADIENAARVAKELFEKIGRRIGEREGLMRQIVQMRAMEAPVKQLRGAFRWQVFLKMYAKGRAQEILQMLSELSAEADDPHGVRVAAEVNPASLM